jgi:Anti-anti-sigma regulatory factor (antagonist of anti-sigma factor)
MLDINLEFRKGILFVRLDGRLNNLTISKFEREIISLIEDNGIGQIFFNLRNLTRIDKEGIKVLIKINNMVKKRQGLCMYCESECIYVNEKLSNLYLNNYLKKQKNELDALTLV